MDVDVGVGFVGDSSPDDASVRVESKVEMVSALCTGLREVLMSVVPTPVAHFDVLVLRCLKRCIRSEKCLINDTCCESDEILPMPTFVCVTLAQSAAGQLPRVH